MKLTALNLILSACYYESISHTNIKECKSGEFDYLLSSAYDPNNKTFMTKSKGIVFQEHLPIGTKVTRKREYKENKGEKSKLVILYSDSECGDFFVIESVNCD